MESAKSKPKGKPTSTKPNPNPVKHTFESIYPLALEASLNQDSAFISDVISCLPVSNGKFYEVMKGHETEMETLKDNLTRNKIAIKQKLRKRWQDSDNATLQISLYKLLSTDEEFAKLANFKEDKHDDNKPQVTDFEYTVIQ